jgi:hypothetical protein
MLALALRATRSTKMGGTGTVASAASTGAGDRTGCGEVAALASSNRSRAGIDPNQLRAPGGHRRRGVRYRPCISRDAGATWTIERGGLHASYCSAVAFSGDDILVSASTDHFAAQGRIYRRPDQTGWRHSGRRRWPAWVDQRYRRHRLHRHKRLNDCDG